MDTTYAPPPGISTDTWHQQLALVQQWAANQPRPVNVPALAHSLLATFRHPTDPEQARQQVNDMFKSIADAVDQVATAAARVLARLARAITQSLRHLAPVLHAHQQQLHLMHCQYRQRQLARRRRRRQGRLKTVASRGGGHE